MNIKKVILLPVVFGILICTFSSCTTVTVKTGNNFEVVELPDGSTVYLNHDSYIKYDKNFSKRKIEQNGEAYFIVTPDGNPFVVTTQTGEITVTGTEFNVKSGSDEVEIEVEEGSVELKIKDVIEKIKQGESALYNKGKDLYKKGESEFKNRIWTNDMKKEFKKLGKEFKRSGKEIGKELKNIKKEIIKATK